MEYAVTIASISYNAEEYIAEALDSWLEQKTDFPFEIVVSDDGSIDKTCEIVKDYMSRFSNIRLINTGHIGCLPNFIRSLKASKGKYIALCDGDDYWIDPMKLQKQVEFMDNHPENSLCFCAHRHLDVSGSLTIVKRYNSDMEKCPIRDIIMGGGGFMATNSMMYRQSQYIPYNTWAKDAPVGDYPMMLTLAHKGDVGFLANVMCVYRHSLPGSWTSRMASDIKKQRTYHIDRIKMLHEFDEWTENKYHIIILQKIMEIFLIKYKVELVFFLKKMLFFYKNPL
jgi:glycosyltransferase involved in cell wall biosynthesis